MCKLNFRYEAVDVPDKMRIEFEDRVNKKLAVGCEKLNNAGVVVSVNWNNNGQLRGLFFPTDETKENLFLDLKNEIT